MEPTIHNGDVVGWMPAPAFQGDGLYVIHDGFGPVVKRCQWVPGGRRGGAIRMFHDNRAYSEATLPRAVFDDCVWGRVFIIGKVVDPTLLCQAGVMQAQWRRMVPVGVPAPA